VPSGLTPDEETIGLLAKYWGGGAPIQFLERLGRRALMRWYAVYERQAVEEEIVNGILYPDSKRGLQVPPPRQLRALVDKRIAERRAAEREEAERREE